MSSKPYKVILDKSFLQAESKDCPRLCFLKDVGCTFVLTDTLLYELCTGDRGNEWLIAQRKLFPFWDSVEVWHHVGEILRSEIAAQRPTTEVVHQSLTRGVRKWFKSGKPYSPENLPELTASDRELREGTSADAAFAFCRDFSRISPQYSTDIQKAKSQKQDLEPVFSDLLSDRRVVNGAVEWVHGSQEHADTYIQGAEKGFGPEWFAYHNARVSLALCCVFMTNFTGLSSPSDSFRHTKLDAEYVTLLHFADALATNETAGTMAPMCRWLYGNSKTTFSTRDLDAARPADTAIRTEAYYQWERQGRTHGRADGDWFWAKTRLQQQAWLRLGGTNT